MVWAVKFYMFRLEPFHWQYKITKVLQQNTLLKINLLTEIQVFSYVFSEVDWMLSKQWLEQTLAQAFFT